MASWAGVTTTIAAATRHNVVADSFLQLGELGTIITQNQNLCRLESYG